LHLRIDKPIIGLETDDSRICGGTKTDTDSQYGFRQEGAKVDNIRYTISDAAERVHVEKHALRYWEDELGLEIPRNEQGHRYYTQEHIDQFQRIKELKLLGYQLKAIKMILHGGGDILEETGGLMEMEQHAPESKNQMKLEQFQALMTQIVCQAVEGNNQKLGKEISLQVGDRVLKEMDYLMRMQDELEEERYKKLDETIRATQRRRRREKQRKEVTKKKGFFRRRTAEV
jgi:DNA-binding transcriptional MerR regulator